MITKHVWKGRDNNFILKFEAMDINGTVVPADMALITSMLLELEDGQSLTVTKDEPDAYINWWDPALELGVGEAEFNLGDWASDPEGLYSMRLVLFSLDNPDGIVWTSHAKGEIRLALHD